MTAPVIPHSTCRSVLALALSLFFTALLGGAGFERLKYNNPGLEVDLGVGLWAWPLPMDYDGDGDMDLVVVCPDKPYNGAYFFENVSGNTEMPVFKPGRRISNGPANAQVSFVGGRPVVTTPGFSHPDFLQSGFSKPVKLPLPANLHPNAVRANQWRFVDYDGDGKLDLVVGVEDWKEYGWDRAYDTSGRWTNGPLRGFIYVARNTNSNEQPAYNQPFRIDVGGRPLEVFGMPSPCFADFDGDGDLDLICGEFLDRFTYFENTGTRTNPAYSAGTRLGAGGKPLAMDLEMIVVTAVDWNKDGYTDLIVGQEDGRVALLKNTGKRERGVPQFLPPRFFQQQADEVKFGVLATPVSFDWDGDGKDDLVCGNSAGYIGFIRNLGGNPPRWAAPEYLEAGGKPIRIMAGPNGSIQGPAEAKWGYTTISVADWDHDGMPDIVVNSIWGKVIWYRNTGTRKAPRLEEAQPIEVEWVGSTPKPEWNWWQPEGRELVTQWRTTPVVFDLNRDGLNDLVMLDHEGYLAWFERARRSGKLVLLPGKRCFRTAGASTYDSSHKAGIPGDGLLRLNGGVAGKSGRRKLFLADWDGDGRPDLLVNSVNVNVLKNLSDESGVWMFRDLGSVDTQVLAGHDTSPTVVDWEKSGVPDLLVGAEDGHFYFLKNTRERK